jgi:3-oxoacyl-[acyl-carrier protein] reductase
MMDLLLTDKTVFITGASGGIGRELARAFAAEGANLVLHGFSNAEFLGKLIESEGWNSRAIAVSGDVSEPENMRRCMQQGVEKFSRVDCCVVNAGTWPPEDLPLHKLPPERVRRTLEVNLLGAMWTAAAFMDQLAPHPAGHGAALTFIGSTAGRFGEAGHADYSVSKAGMYGLVRTLKNEVVRVDPLARVNMVEPGWTVTEMAREALDTPGAIARIGRTMALRRLARAEDIARAVLMLSSPAASAHITGEVITVAGGMEGRTLWQESDINEDEIRKKARE